VFERRGRAVVRKVSDTCSNFGGVPWCDEVSDTYLSLSAT